MLKCLTARYSVPDDFFGKRHVREKRGVLFKHKLPKGNCISPPVSLMSTVWKEAVKQMG